ncbi:unnamed protein product [Amoebophrya sp. A25]|nr:unnamed protein product [Amoebophrya sp. A25]|eukprot:GSA25T00006689001.1
MAQEAHAQLQDIRVPIWAHQLVKEPKATLVPLLRQPLDRKRRREARRGRRRRHQELKQVARRPTKITTI